jgi:hypothetical protein
MWNAPINSERLLLTPLVPADALELYDSTAIEGADTDTIRVLKLRTRT